MPRWAAVSFCSCKNPGTAGSAGGFSVTPALSVQVAGADMLAHLGRGESALRCTGDVNVTANSTLTRLLNADAAAVGGGVGVGSAVGVSVFHDHTEARLSRSVKAKNINVKTAVTGVGKLESIGEVPVQLCYRDSVRYSIDRTDPEAPTTMPQ